MIEFLGEPTGACKKYVLRTECLVGFIYSFVPSMIIAVPAVYAAITWDQIFFIVIPVLLVFVVLAALMPLKKPHCLILPKTIRLQGDTIISESEKFCEIRNLDDVKEVIDKGDWYQIKFFFPNKSARFVCQKNLATQGALAEFEKIFEAKLIRRSCAR